MTSSVVPATKKGIACFSVAITTLNSFKMFGSNKKILTYIQPHSEWTVVQLGQILTERHFAVITEDIC
jgi:hypothetical protein